MTGNSTFEYYNANRDGKNVGDCRQGNFRCPRSGLGHHLLGTMLGGYLAADMPSGNPVWGKYLRRKGWRRYLPEYEDITVQEFAHQHPYGVYLLHWTLILSASLTGIVDTWNSGGKDRVVLLDGGLMLVPYQYMPGYQPYYQPPMADQLLHSFVGHSISPFPSRFLQGTAPAGADWWAKHGMGERGEAEAMAHLVAPNSAGALGQQRSHHLSQTSRRFWQAVHQKSMILWSALKKPVQASQPPVVEYAPLSRVEALEARLNELTVVKEMPVRTTKKTTTKEDAE